jgi:hypothetical protein
MLTIRHEQMKLLEEVRLQDFRRRLQEFLANLMARQGKTCTTDQIMAEVDALQEKARDFHLKREIHIARLGEILCSHQGGISNAKLGRDALRILYRYDVDPAEKLRRFEELSRSDVSRSEVSPKR